MIIALDGYSKSSAGMKFLSLFQSLFKNLLPEREEVFVLYARQGAFT